MAAWIKLIFLSAVVVAPVISTLVSITESGGYQQVVVAVSPKIGKPDIEALLLNLEKLFRHASVSLHIATRNQTFFQEVVILLPKALQNATLPENKVPVVERKYLSSPDIFIVNETIFGNRPFTIQNSGCGEGGLYVKIPSSFLSLKEEEDGEQVFASRAKVFVHEWAHYRYGVFDEHGVLGDELYPLYYSVAGERVEPKWQLTSCLNKKVPFILRKISGERCQEFSDDCLPVLENKEEIESSLMYDPSLPKVAHFCDGEIFDHDRDAPTKQNSLCREESTWTVMSRHVDFRVKRNFETTKNLLPSFKYVVEPDPKIAFVVEATDKMTVNDQMDQIRNAFSYFVLYDLPVNSRVGIISMKSEGSTQAKPLFLELKSNTERERLCDAFPDPYGAGDACVHCGIRRALMVLNSNKNAKISGTIVLATTADVSANWIETLTEELTKEDVKLFVIFFSGGSNKVPLLGNLAVVTGGRLFMIPEKLGNTAFHSPVTVLYEMFRTVYRSLSWTYEVDALVTQKVFHNSTSDNSFIFNIDESVSSFRLIITVSNFESVFPVVKDEVSVRYDNYEFIVSDPSFTYQRRIPAYIFTIKNPQSGNWTLRFHKKRGFTKHLAVIVRASQQSWKSIKVRSWIKPLHGMGKPPGIVYAEVFKGEHPILNANISAFVIHPDVTRVSNFELVDAGEGDPDITRNDGIYSRYFTDFSSEGYYTLSVIVRYNTKQDLEKRNTSVSASSSYPMCCGSSIPADDESLSDDFVREHIFGTFYVKMNEAFIRQPPRRIFDLRVINVRWLENSRKHFTLQWTAPGDDYDHDTAQAYEIKVFRSREDALNRFETSQVLAIDEWNIHGPWLQPKPAGTVQTTIIELRNISFGTYFLAMRAVDSAGNPSDVSNVVKLHHQFVVEVSTTTDNVNDPDKLLTTTTISDLTTGTSGETVKAADLTLIIAITCGLLFLMIIIAFVLFLYFARHKRLQDKQKSGNASGFPLEQSRNASDNTLCRSVSSLGDSEGISVISPVGSWPASALLSHYEMVRDAKRNDHNSAALKQEQESFDTVSQTSSLYSSIHRNPEKNSFMYNSMNYRHPAYRVIENYPFNPDYTSSLRRPQDVRSPSRLNTDV